MCAKSVLSKFQFWVGAAGQQAPLWVHACRPTGTNWGSHSSVADSYSFPEHKAVSLDGFTLTQLHIPEDLNPLNPNIKQEITVYVLQLGGRLNR